MKYFITTIFSLIFLFSSQPVVAAGLTVVDRPITNAAMLTTTDGLSQSYVFNGTAWSEQSGEVVWWKESVGTIVCAELSQGQQAPFSLVCRDFFGGPWRTIATFTEQIPSTRITLAGDGATPQIDALRPNTTGGLDWWNYNGTSWKIILHDLPFTTQLDSYGRAACAVGYSSFNPGVQTWCDWSGSRRATSPVMRPLGFGGEIPRQPIMSEENIAINFIDFHTGRADWFVLTKQNRLSANTALPDTYYEAVTDGSGGIVWRDATTISHWNQPTDTATHLMNPGAGAWLDENTNFVYSVQMTSPSPFTVSAPIQIWPVTP